mgnify:CR=1 FL=1
MAARRLSRISLLVALMVLGAAVALPVPGTTTPLTLQLVPVLLAGGLLGPVDGPLAVLIYLALGVAGLPVFSGLRAGPAVLFGPTGGYLWGFVLTAGWIGWWAGPHRRPGWVRLAAAMTSGMIFTYACGVWQMALVLQYTLLQAAVAGIVPFVVADALKIGLAVALAGRLQHIRRA